MNSFYSLLYKNLFFVLLILAAGTLCPLRLYAKQPELKIEQPLKEGQELYDVRFFSLRQRHSIGPAKFILNDDGKFVLSIENEKLMDPKGTYNINGFSFSGNVEFTIQKTKPYHYVLQFKGFSVFSTYLVGLLTLSEFIDETELTQRITFFFFAFQDNSEKKDNKKLTPFF